MQPPRDCTIDTSHLGTLFAIDKRLTGRFYENDIIDFAKIYASQALHNGRKDDFQSKFQAYCTLKMWNEISKPDGVDILSIKNYYGGDFRSFLDLMQRTAEEQGFMKLDEDELDDVVPLVILKNFSKHFINGFVKLMVIII
eukprot:gene6770-8395_t